jgi:hypothetical protein
METNSSIQNIGESPQQKEINHNLADSFKSLPVRHFYTHKMGLPSKSLLQNVTTNEQKTDKNCINQFLLLQIFLTKFSIFYCTFTVLINIVFIVYGIIYTIISQME